MCPVVHLEHKMYHKCRIFYFNSDLYEWVLWANTNQCIDVTWNNINLMASCVYTWKGIKFHDHVLLQILRCDCTSAAGGGHSCRRLVSWTPGQEEITGVYQIVAFHLKPQRWCMSNAWFIPWQNLCNNLNYRHRMAQYAGRASVGLHTQVRHVVHWWQY